MEKVSQFRLIIIDSVYRVIMLKRRDCLEDEMNENAERPDLDDYFDAISLLSDKLQSLAVLKKCSILLSNATTSRLSYDGHTRLRVPALGEKLWQSGIRTNCVVLEKRLDSVVAKYYIPEEKPPESDEDQTQYSTA